MCPLAYMHGNVQIILQRCHQCSNNVPVWIMMFAAPLLYASMMTLYAVFDVNASQVTVGMDRHVSQKFLVSTRVMIVSPFPFPVLPSLLDTQHKQNLMTDLS